MGRRSGSSSRKRAKVVVKDLKPEGLGYKMGGQEVSPESPDCLAKSVPAEEGARKYFLKCGSYPLGNTSPCNPNAIDFRPDLLTKNDPGTGLPYYAFREVTRAGWDLYLAFLQTGNVGNWNQCVRLEGLL